MKQRYESGFYNSDDSKVIYQSGIWDLVELECGTLVEICKHYSANYFTDEGEPRSPDDMREFAKAYNKLNS